MVGFFSTPDDLATEVVTAITTWADRQLIAEVAQMKLSRPGPTRNDSVPSSGW
jgi:hypothetical protein